jgi:hypothetical protein
MIEVKRRKNRDTNDSLKTVISAIPLSVNQIQSNKSISLCRRPFATVEASWYHSMEKDALQEVILIS